MQQDQIKTLLVNIFTGVLVVGVGIVAYNVFIKKGATSVSTVNNVAKIAQETAQIGTEIDATVSDLGELSNAISNSVVILELPAFKNLKDFTVAIPSESVGRQNPFILTPWKVQQNAIVGASANSAPTLTSSVYQSTPSPAPSSANTSTPTGFVNTGI